MQSLRSAIDPVRRDLMHSAKTALYETAGESTPERAALQQWVKQYAAINNERYNGSLFSNSNQSVLKAAVVAPVYGSDAHLVNGFEIINKCFDAHFAKNDKIFAFGEDLGKIGDVNQGFAGLQEKYGENRIFDVGIREATIVGQELVWRCVVCVDLLKFNIWTIYYTDYSQSAMIWLLYNTAPKADKSTGYYPHQRSPTGRNMAYRLADGYDFTFLSRGAFMCSTQHDTGSRYV